MASRKQLKVLFGCMHEIWKMSNWGFILTSIMQEVNFFGYWMTKCIRNIHKCEKGEIEVY